jgi:hypothetical protein
MITLNHTTKDQQLADNVRATLESNNYTITNQNTDQTILSIIIISEQAAKENLLVQAVRDTISRNQQILFILKEAIQLPRHIEHLPVLDFSYQFNNKALLDQVNTLTAPDAPKPDYLASVNLIQSNTKLGIGVALIVLLMFGLAILGVLTGALVPEPDEFAGPETQVYLTRNYFIDEAIALDDPDLSFDQKIQQARPTIQPYLILTATGIASFSESTHYPRTTGEAINFPATLERLSTHVQDRAAATVTALSHNINQDQSLEIDPTATPEGE